MIVGVLGGGQLARMLILAGAPLGLRFRVLDPDSSCPAGQLAELIVGAYDDPAALDRLARSVDVITYEFENVPARALEHLHALAPIFPPAGALATSQDRLLEKQLFNRLGIATPAYAPVDSIDDLRAAAKSIGLPAVLKTRRFGYDGKGQVVIADESELAPAFLNLGGGRTPKADLILEGFVRFQRELSVLAVRSASGDTAVYPPVHNTHLSGILARSVAPAPDVPQSLADELAAAARAVLTELNYVGLLAIEFFDLGPDAAPARSASASSGGLAAPRPSRLLANEMAPRVHNSGHWTIEGADCSQFENHLRAVCALPLGSTAPRAHSVMLNIIGDEPDTRALLSIPGLHLHMYGKSPRPGRKLGHATICAATAAEALAQADQAARALRNA